MTILIELTGIACPLRIRAVRVMFLQWTAMYNTWLRKGTTDIHTTYDRFITVCIILAVLCHALFFFFRSAVLVGVGTMHLRCFLLRCVPVVMTVVTVSQCCSVLFFSSCTGFNPTKGTYLLTL